MDDALLTILLLFVLGIFAWHAYTRGFLAMLTQFGFMLAAALVGNPDWLGATVIRVVNRLYMIFLMTIGGGAQIVAGSDFSAENFARIFKEAREKPPLIPAQRKELVLFIFMLLLIIASFAVASRIKKSRNKLLAVFLGLMNGLMLIYLIRPVLGVNPGLLPTLDAQTPLEGVLGIFQLAISIILLPFAMMTEKLGPWAIGLFIILIILIAVSSGHTSKARKS